MLVKVLGFIDMLGAFMFLLQSFGIDPFTRLILFSAGLLFVKSLFIFTGEFVLSGIDFLAAVFLILSIFLALPVFISWALAFLLIAKGIVSFI